MENINERYRLIESFGQLVEQLVEDEINLVIPEYQRSYSWDRSNAEILLNDLKNCKGNYFLGLYLLDWQSSIRSFSIVDGQQRLTTLFLLLAVLKNREDFQNFRESSFEKFLYPSSQFESSTRLSLQESDKALFRKLILGQRNVGNAGGDRYDSQRRLREVFCYFKDKCQSLSVTECEKIVKTISSAKVLIHVEQNVGMAMRVFELLNDRGKRLTDIEVVKSYSMSLAWNLARDESDRKKFTNDVKDVFSEIYRTLKEINSYKKGYSGDEVLRYHVIAFSDWKDKVDYTNARETFKNILNGHGTMSSLQRELDSLAQTYSDLLEIYRGVYENKDKNKIFRWVKNVYVLNRMASSIPLLLSIKKIYPDDDEFFDLVCNYLELFCYRAFDVRGLRSDAGASVLYVMAKDINHHDPKYSDKRKILTGLARLIVKYCSFDDNVFLEYLRDPNFYVSRGGSEERYLFVKYENSLVLECRRETKGTEKKFISDVKKIMNEGEDFFSIEHVVPQEETTKGYYRKLVISGSKWEVGRKYRSGRFEKNYLHSIGNLVLSNKASNSGKGNNYPEKKKWDVYASQEEIRDIIKKSRPATIRSRDGKRECVYLDSSKSMIPMKFNVDKIECRINKISKFALGYWSLGPLSKNEDSEKKIEEFHKYMRNRLPLI